MHILVNVLLLIISSAIEINTEEINLSNLRDGLKDIDWADLFKFNVGTFLKRYGYPFENHEVVTHDGYVLGVHRIPYGRNESSASAASEAKPAILLMHGLGSSSNGYFILGPEKSLALMLADAGYDVWLGNNRGNVWSRKHLTLDPDKNSTFWDFSFDELGAYDVPAIIDHILNTTGHQNISYIGHSQGTTQFLVAMSTRFEYNDKINVMIGLAPIAYMGNVKSSFLQFVKDYYTVYDLASNALNITEVLPHSSLLSLALAFICSDRSPFQPLCTTYYFFMNGESDQLNKTTLSIIAQTSGGTSIRGSKHYLQEVKSGHFRQYDYGLVTNLVKYGQAEPPDYDLSKILVPIILFSGGKDELATEADVKRLAEELTNVQETSVVDSFSHKDFLYGVDAPSLYKDIIKLLEGSR